jgi:hypothetical protein
MPKEMPTPNEVMRLMQSATDAVNDLGGSGSNAHASDDATGARARLHRAKGKVKDWGSTVHALARQRPFTCIFVAFVLGVGFGLLGCRSRARRG